MSYKTKSKIYGKLFNVSCKLKHPNTHWAWCSIVNKNADKFIEAFERDQERNNNAN